jgi:ADP-ribosyl-[dinitrogen reductase] hydrolase
MPTSGTAQIDGTLRSRHRGCLIGLAVGDAIGTTLEFRAPGSFDPIDDMVGGGPFRLKPGEWTDDTSMALCLAESLIERKGFDPVDQLERYVRWHDEGHLSSNGKCFDIGNTVAEALDRFRRSRSSFCGSTDPNAAGNGSLMRLAPVPMYFRSEPAVAVKRAGLSSRTTHGTAEAVDACRYFAGVLILALNSRSKKELLEYETVSHLYESEPLCEGIRNIARGSFKEKEPPEIRGTGYVIDCLEAALWAFDRTDTFAEAILAAINLGNDADTTGAVCGQIAGAYYGEEAIPANWREQLAHRQLIESFADGLLQG